MFDTRDYFTLSDFLFSDYISDSLNQRFNIINDDTLKYPATDIRYDDTNVYIDIAVTGIPKEHLSGEIDGNLIKIFHKKPEKAMTNGERIAEYNKFTYARHKICKKEFEIAYKVDTKYDIQKSEIKVENGEMTITIPLKEENIPIKKSLKIG